MPLRATTNGDRKKVRCPKCTALFTEPAKSTFDCPICSCRLSVNGTIALADVVPNQTNAEESAQGRAAATNGNDDPSRTQSPMGFVEKEGCKGDKRASHAEIQPITDTEKRFPRVSENDKKKRQKPVVGNLEDPHSVHEEAGRDIDTTGVLASDNTAEEDPSLLRVADSLIVADDEGIEGQDCVEKHGACDHQRLQSQLFRTSRCEFSFKYSLGGVSPVESNGQSRHRKGSLSSKIVPSEAAPRNEASDTPLYPPLRVRISNPDEESSDQSENGRYSFNSETDSSEESDFGFPAPRAEGLRDIVLPSSFGQSEIFGPSSDCIVSAAPHQLELQDDNDVIDHLQESIEHFEGAKVELPKQVENADAAREYTISAMLDHNLDVVDSKEMLLMKGGAGQLLVRGSEQGSGNADELETGLTQDIIVHQGEVGKTESNANVPCKVSEPMDVLVSPDGGRFSKLGGQCNGNQESIDADADNVKSCEEDVVSVPSCSTFDLANSAILSNQEDVTPKVSASSLSRIDCSDETRSIHVGPQFQMAGSPATSRDVVDQSHIYRNIMSSGTIRYGTHEGQLDDSIPGKINVSDHQRSSSMENADLELDLYSHPIEVGGNDSSSGKSSYSAMWEEKKSAVTVLSDGVLVNGSTGRMYYEKDDPLRSSHAVENQGRHSDLHEMDGNLGSYSQYSVNNVPGFSLTNSQPYVVTNHHFVSDHLGFGSSSTNQMYSYPVPSQSLVLPAGATFQNHAVAHCGYHAVSPACMLCSYHPHPHMQPPHIPHCTACYNHSGSIAYTSGHSEHWNCYQAHRDSAPPTYTSSLVEGSQARSFSTNLAHRHDFSNAVLRSQASLARKVGQYPPLPRDSAAPYVTCKGCSRVLQVPSGLPPTDGITQKLRCGACRKITKFSVNHYNQHRHVVSSIPPPELDSMGGATSMLPLVQSSMNSRQLPVVTATENIKPSYDHDMCKVNPGLRKQSLHKVRPQPDNTTPNSRNSDQNPQGGEFFRGQPRNRNAAPSIGRSPLENAASLTDVMSPRRADLRSTNSFGFDRLKVNPAVSFHLPVDEKEEGLDFGAPRISDGDSLDHSESRMRSPENIQAFHQRNPVEVPPGVALGGHSPPPEQVPGSPLLVLLNQESTRFRLTLEPRVPLEESRSAACSPASESAALYDKPAHGRLRGRERGNSQSHGTSAQHFVSKGPKYIAGLLRRSLKDFGRGGQ